MFVLYVVKGDKMSVGDNLFLILVDEVRQELEENEMESATNCRHQLFENIKLAMNVAKNHWLVTDQNIQFRGAIAGTMLFYGAESEEFKRLEWETQQLKIFGNIIEASQKGFSIAPEAIEIDNKFTPIGLLKFWREIKDQK